MAHDLSTIRMTDGGLPDVAWPGGYPLFYFDDNDDIMCPFCANIMETEEDERDPDQMPQAYDVNWEDVDLHCDECGQLIECAYSDY